MELKALLVLFILIFYSTLTLFYGAYGATLSQVELGELEQNIDRIPLSENNDNFEVRFAKNWILTDAFSATPTTPDTVTEKTLNEGTNFFSNVVTGIKDAPTWINVVVFIPLFLMLIYLLLPTY